MSKTPTVRIVADTKGGFITINAREFDPSVHELYGTKGERETAAHLAASEQAHAAGNAFRPLREGASPESASECSELDRQRRELEKDTKRSVLDRALKS